MTPLARFRSSLVRLGATLKFQIVALCVAIAVVSVAATTWFVLSTLQAQTRQTLLRRSAADVERAATSLGGKLGLLSEALQGTARHLAAPRLADPPALNRFLAHAFALSSLFDPVFIAGPQGRVLARAPAVPDESLPDVADRDYFQQVMRTGRPAVSHPLVGRVTTEPVVIFATPVTDGHGAVIAVLGGLLRLNDAQLLPVANAQADGSRELVIDTDGHVLSHPDPRRLLGRVRDEPGLAAALAEWSGAPPQAPGHGFARLGEGYLVAMAQAPGASWIVVRLIPEAVALRPLAAGRATAWRVGALVALLGALVAGALAWVLTRPISRLQEGARALLADDAAQRVRWPAAHGEIGDLSGTFQRVIEQRQRRQDETQRLLVRLQAVLDNAQTGIAFTRGDCFELVSSHLCSVFGQQREALIGRSTRVIYASEAEWRRVGAAVRPALDRPGGFDGKLELVRAGGELFWAHIRGRALRAGDRSAGVIWIIDDVTQEFEHERRLSWRATHDALTGLPNRAHFEALLAHNVADPLARPLCALFIDLDRFKQVNDTAGHAAGDALLRGVTQRLLGAVRQSDTVARLGGDEFAVLLPHCPGAQGRQIAEKLRAAVEAYRLPWQGQTYAVGASVGLVQVDGSFASADEVLQAADQACYDAKRVGRNRVAVYAGSLAQGLPTAPADAGEPGD